MKGIQIGKPQQRGKRNKSNPDWKRRSETHCLQMP